MTKWYGGDSPGGSQWFGGGPPFLMGFEAFVLSGGSAGDHTVTGIRTDDTILMAVYFAGAGSDVTDVAEIASEFTITAADTVNNDGGTDTTSGKVLFTWVVSNEPVA